MIPFHQASPVLFATEFVQTRNDVEEESSSVAEFPPNPRKDHSIDLSEAQWKGRERDNQYYHLVETDPSINHYLAESLTMNRQGKCNSLGSVCFE